MTKSHILAIQTLARKYPDIIAGYQYGSTINGTTHASSDLDIGFIVRSKANVDIPTFAVNINDILKYPNLDVTVIDEYESPVLAMNMISGRVIFQASLSARAQMETHILKRFEDYVHLRSISQKYLASAFRASLKSSISYRK